jgi:broad specificity phosphatase PhoE
MLYLTIVRHAPTSLNKEGVFMGILDVPAIEEEVIKIENGEYKSYFREEYDTYFSSPLSRAYSTAQALFQNKKIKKIDDLLEKNLGAWAGLNKKEVRKKSPEAFLESGMLNPFFTPPEGETIEEMVERVQKFLNMCIDVYRNADKLDYKIIAVTHNGVVRVIRHLIEGISLEDTFSKNEKHILPTTFVYDDKWKLL